jgi:CMP-N-acetylneuraminic acid synthetase
MEILGFIPARGGSRGIPKKNLYHVNGHPLIYYSIKTALESRINRLIVSTDSQEIAEVGLQFGAEVPFLRPKELAQDHSTIEDALMDALNRLGKEKYHPDIIVLLHPITPFRRTQHINASIDLLIKNSADTVVSVSDPMEHPGDMVYWDKEGQMKYLLDIDHTKMQRQHYPKYYFHNGVVYVFTAKSFMENKDRFGSKVIPYQMRQIDSIDIDSMDDSEIAEAILKLRK